MQVKQVEILDTEEGGKKVRLSVLDENNTLTAFVYPGIVQTSVYSHRGGLSLSITVATEAPPKPETPVLLPNANRR